MWQFFKGYVILQTEGTALARFLRNLSESGIPVMHLKPVSSGCMQFEICKKDFFRLHRLRKGLPVRVHVLQRKGLPFLIRRLLKRPVLCFGTVFVLIALFLLSQRIWMIRFEGIETVDREAVLELLGQHGLYIGARPKGPVLITAANDLSICVDHAAWIGLDREGITLKVSVVEEQQETEKPLADGLQHIVADKDGIVTEIRVMRGQACVKVGDAVKAGDILISGIVQRNDAVYRTRADGTVRCAVNYEAERPVEPKITEAVQTDRTETVRAIRIGTFKLLQSRPEFERYRLTDLRTAEIGDRLPIYCDTYLAYEIVLRERMLDEEEAEQLALSDAREAALEKVPKDACILNQYGTIRKIDGQLHAYVMITAEENIGRTEEYPNDG